MKKNATPIYLALKNQASRILFLVTLSFILMSASLIQDSKIPPAQQATITGKITEAGTGKLLVGVTVEVKGTKTVAKSQKDGSFSIILPKGSKTLVFTLTGYQFREIDIAGKTTTLDVKMSVKEADPEIW